MKRHIPSRAILVAASLMILSACADRSDPESEGGLPPREEQISAADSWALSDEQLRALSDKALDGDWDAADRVAMYYGTLDHRSPEADFWTRIAAENGMPLWMEAYGLTLGRLGGDANCRRAIFWLRKTAEAHGGQKAQELERQIKQMQSDPACDTFKLPGDKDSGSRR